MGMVAGIGPLHPTADAVESATELGSRLHSTQADHDSPSWSLWPPGTVTSSRSLRQDPAVWHDQLRVFAGCTPRLRNMNSAPTHRRTRASCSHVVSNRSS